MPRGIGAPIHVSDQDTRPQIADGFYILVRKVIKQLNFPGA